MDDILIRGAHIAEMFSEPAAVLVITFGSLEAFVRLLWIGVTKSAEGPALPVVPEERRAVAAVSAR